MEYKKGDIVLVRSNISEKVTPGIFIYDYGHSYLIRFNRTSEFEKPKHLVLEKPHNSIIKPEFNDDDIILALENDKYLNDWEIYIVNQLILIDNTYDLQILKVLCLVKEYQSMKPYINSYVNKDYILGIVNLINMIKSKHKGYET